MLGISSSGAHTFDKDSTISSPRLQSCEPDTAKLRYRTRLWYHGQRARELAGCATIVGRSRQVGARVSINGRTNAFASALAADTVRNSPQNAQKNAC